jgi:putative ABC transport system permease protein
VLGAVKSTLVRQFLVESLLMNVAALLLSSVAFFLLLPAFDRFVGRDSYTGFALTPDYWWLFLVLFAGGTFLSGLYPSLVLASYQPIAVLKGVFKNSARGISLRKGLIVVQFITSVVLIAGTIIVYQQVNYMRKQHLGVNIDQTLVLQGAGSLGDTVYQNVFQPFKNEMLQQGNIKNVSASTSVMGNEIYWASGTRRIDKPNHTAVTLFYLGVDYDFIPAFDLKLKAGRNFSKEFKTDEKAALINERAAQLLGFKNASEALNGRFRGGRDTITIVGVVSNYHHQGLQKAIDPMVLLLRPDARNYYSVKIGTADVQKTIAATQKVWNKYFPADPLNYFFLDEAFNEQYKSDTLFGKVFGVFAFLAILIACFGLLGLSAYNVLQRAKEIGIRKVLGASVQNILVMLSKDFLKLILVALVLAIPVAWFIMHEWLQDFAYRISIAWWVFVLAGLISLTIALLVIILQALKAAVENPVKSLRTE